MNLKYSIIIPTYNHCDDLLKPCIESIIKYTDLSDKEIIIVANGCVDNTKEYIESLDKNIFKLLWFDEALGYTKATNEGIKNSNGEFIIFLNNDTIILNDNWIDMLINYWNSSNNVGIVGPSKLYFEDYPFILFYCAMTSKKIINEIGLLDETFNPGYGEDIDFSIRLIKNGYDIIVSETNNDFPIYHIGEGTMHSDLMIDKWDKITNRNKNILKDRINNNYYDKFKINIIVPTYNRYIELKIALNSILNQTKKEINVLVISDGHDETVLDIVNEYDKKDDLINFKYYSIEHEGNLGSKPRIHGIENLDDNGYVCFLDDDNELYPEYIENMINNIIPEKYDISICQINVNNTYIMPLKKEYVSFENIDSLNFMVSNKIAKKCKDKWLQKKDEKVTHDFDFLNECIKYSDFNFIPKVLANHNNYNYSKYLKEQDSLVFDEIFTKNMYNVKENEIKNKIVIDIGANKGYFSIYAILNGAKLVYAYEPDIINYNKLLENIKYYNIKNIIPINKAVYKDKNQYKMMQGDVLSQIIFDNNISDNYITVDSIDIDTIIYQINDNNIHVKFDCEGSEYDIFLNSDNKIYNKIEMLYGEIHNGLHPNINYNSNLLKEHFENNYKEIIPEIIYTPGTYLENGDFIPLEIHHDMVKYQRKNKIYDCFPFFNEFELLEIRLNELYDIVDEFIIIESNKTHSGLDKPFYLTDNLKRFEKFKDKIHIEYFNADEIDFSLYDFDKNWVREHLQRNFASEYIKNKADKNDYIIISDADEIPKKESILEHIDSNTNLVGVLELDRFMYYLNYKNIETNEKQLNAKICKCEILYKFDFNDIRFCESQRFDIQYYNIKNAGWHFTFMGGIENVIRKVKSFAHQEYNHPDKIKYERMLSLFENGKDVYDTESKWELVDIDDSFPKIVQENKSKYIENKWIKENNRITIGYINHNNDLFYKHLNQSINKSKNKNFDILFEKSSDNIPAINYNKIIEKSKNDYILFVHEDFEFHENFIDDIFKTINKYPDFGVLGVTGFDDYKNHRITYHSNNEYSIELDFFDPFCFVINKKNNIFFDYKTFNELHLYAEDYCLQSKFKNLKNRTIITDINKIKHIGFTYSKNNKMWGNYDKYYEKFYNKWNKKYSIIIPTYNRYDLIEKCVNSIINNTDLNNVEVLIISNGCKDETKDFIESLGEPFKLFYYDEPLGYTKATNIGLKNAIGNYIILLNNDVVILDKSWIDILEEPFNLYENVGMTGPMLFKGVEGELTDFIQFFCAMTTRKIINEIGLLDESFNPGGVEDIDYGIRLNIAGYKLIEVPEKNSIKNESISFGEFPICHPGGTTVRNLENWDNILIRNNKLLKNKFPNYFKGEKWIENLSKSKVYDCFMFFNEFELLEIRLNELYDVVDYFVLVECNYTHQGNKKPLYYNENKNKFEKFNDKIIHIILDEFPDFEITEYFFWVSWQFLDLNKNIDLDNLDDETRTKYTKNWKREDYQKFEIFKGLNNCNDDDIIIISDVDEIINSNIIKNYKDDNINKLILDHYLYDFNTKSPNKWDKPFICRYKNIKKYKKDNLIKDFALLRNNDNLNFNKIKDAGWHFSYFGNINDIKLKLESFAHEELNIDINDEYIKENIKNFQKVNIDESYPKYVINNIDKYKKIGFIKEIDNMKDKMIKESPTLYNELFVMNINQVDPIEIKNKTIIDIGGHLGYFSILCSYFDPKEIYTFEPVEIFYDKLLDFVKDIKNIHTYNLAVLDKSIDYVSMDINGESSNIWGNGKKDTKCVSLEDIVNNYINKDDDLVLKLDCEGSEFNILYNTPEYILKRFSTMYIEFHDEMNPDYQYKTNDIIEKLENMGYEKFKGTQAGYYDENNNFTPSPVSIWKFKRKNIENMKVTTTISTRNRYFTTLPLCIHSIATQTYRPSELIIYDDNEDDKRIDLRNDPIYSTLFKLLEINGISWRVIFGKGEGQVKNHQLALKDSNYDFIWRLDDDNVPESNVLETLVKNINDKTGAIGGLIIDPNNITSNSNHSNLIEDIDMASNEQWNINSPKFDYKIVDHLYSSFLFRKEAGKHGYEMNLSRVGHREETMFTYEMKLQGWEIAINSKCITWHYHNPFGGIRDNTVKEMWDHDENIFRNKLKEWNIYNDNNFIDIVLDNGIGDHYAFKMILNELNEKNKKINLYCCFPEVFADDNVKLYSIHDALVKYNNNISQFNIYKWMDEMNWKGTLLEAFKKLYL